MPLSNSRHSELMNSNSKILLNGFSPSTYLYYKMTILQSFGKVLELLCLQLQIISPGCLEEQVLYCASEKWAAGRQCLLHR